MKTIPLGPWPLGMQNTNDVSKLLKGALADASDVDIDSTGCVASRAGYQVLGAGVRDLFEYGAKRYGVYNGYVVEIDDAGMTNLFGPQIGSVGWGVLNDNPVFITTDLIGVIEPTGARIIGVETPGAFLATPSTGGGMSMGRYGVAVSYQSASGEEGGLSGVNFYEVGENEGLVIHTPYPLASAAKVNVYITEPDGETLYLVSTLAPGGSTQLGGLQRGVAAQTHGLSRMPGGKTARYWRGRLLVARGRTLICSEPLRYGLYDTRKGFIEFETEIVFVEPVEAGVFVGLRDIGVRFLAGTTPDDFKQIVATTVPAQPWCSASVKTERMNEKLQLFGNAAVWLSDKGFVLGSNDGRVVFPQADVLSGLALGIGRLSVRGDRLVAFSQ